MKKGIPASKGYAIGKVVIKPTEEIKINEAKEISVETEKEKLQKAIDASRKQLLAICEKAKQEIGEKEADVFKSHLLFLDDPEFVGAAFSNIETNKESAEKALSSIVTKYSDMFSQMEDEYMRERGADIKDVGNRILRNLAGKTDNVLSNISENTVVVAHDLTPSDTAQIDKKKVIAFLTDVGGRTSHSAIMARTLEIPAIVGLINITELVKNGDNIIVDGIEGSIFINPDEKTIELYKQKKSDYEAEKEKIKELASKESITKSGKKVIVAGNIGSPEDVNKVIENGGEGVGLFRTEFLYMDKDRLPNEDEQFEAYKYAAEKLNGKPIVIRTLDIGGDKKLPYLPLPKEMNPFLGFRAIRLCLHRKDIFRTQLRALLRASNYGNIQIMFPMISSLEEFFEAKKLLNTCMTELENEGVPFNKGIQTGIMVEIPAAAVMADEFAKYVDFFSIGTNDLIQYTLAADRMNENVSYLYNPMHPAVLRLIKMTIEAAHKQGKWCGMCGEMAGDENAIPTLLEYGLDEFSMSASSILTAKKIIINS